MPEVSEKLADSLRGQFNVLHDIAGSIGKRYRRQDEQGTPFCITIDGDTVENGTVTVRDRDTLEQETISLDSVAGYLADAIAKGS